MSGPDLVRPGTAMERPERPAGGRPLAVLERICRQAPRTTPGSCCELCSAELGEPHGHVVNLESRSLLCACRACHLLFATPGAAGGRFKAVGARVVAVPDFTLTPVQWEALQIPVSVAFFLYNSELARTVAFYPSPAGPTESQLALGAFEELAGDYDVLADVAADIEAVLVRVAPGASDCFVVPVDLCYELVGRLRRTWRGFDGGAEARTEIEAMFDRLRSRARPASRAGRRG